MATALGQRYLVRYYEGTATVEQLNSCLAKGWINQAEHDRAIAGEPPEGYQPSPQRTSDV